MVNIAKSRNDEDDEKNDEMKCQPCDDDDSRLRSKLRHMLKVFSEKRQGGALMPVSSAEWEVEAVLDSGATVTVIPAHVGQGYDILPSAASKAGVMYEIANGEEIPNL